MAVSKRVLYLLAAAFLLVLALWAVYVGQEVRPQNLAKPLSQLDLSLGKWRALGADERLDQETLDLLKPQDYLLRNYMNPQGTIGAVFVAYFGLQKEGAMIHSPRHCLPGSGWQITRRQEVELPTASGTYRLNHLILSQGLERLSVLYWYQGRGRIEPNEYRDRLSLLWDGLFLHRTDGALVRITSVMGGDEQEMLKGQLEMAESLIAALGRLLPPPGGGQRP